MRVVVEAPQSLRTALGVDECVARGWFLTPIAELEIAVSHRVRLCHAPYPALRVRRRRDDVTLDQDLGRVPRRRCRARTWSRGSECLRVVPCPEVPGQHDAPREVTGIRPRLQNYVADGRVGRCLPVRVQYLRERVRVCVLGLLEVHGVEFERID